jgi:alkyl hydroperoxide reductase subunit AhpC
MDGNWVIVLAYPRAITPVCAQEIRTVERLRKDFERRRCKIIGLAVEPVDDLDDWLAGIETVAGQTPSYPLIGSDDMQVARLFDLVRSNDADGYRMRHMIVIGPDRRVKLSVAYPMVTDAIFCEMLQMIEALQKADAIEAAVSEGREHPAVPEAGKRRACCGGAAPGVAEARFPSFPAVNDKD